MELQALELLLAVQPHLLLLVANVRRPEGVVQHSEPGHDGVDGALRVVCVHDGVDFAQARVERQCTHLV